MIRSDERDSGRGVAETLDGDLTARREAELLAERERGFANTLIEAMPGIFYFYDEQRRFLRFNRNFEQVSGYAAAEIAQMHPLDFFKDTDKALVEQSIAEVFRVGQASVEADFIAKDGSTAPYLFTGRRVQFEGKPCLVGMGIDISERRRAEAAIRKSEERYRTTLDTMLEGCQIIDRDWRYVYLNHTSAVHNRRPNSELLGARMPEAWPGIEATPVYQMLERCMRERVALHQENEFVFPNGEPGWFDVRAQPIPEGIFVLSMDISERKRAERALRELNESLELKVSERMHDLERALERAEAADRVKSAFLATMSHELRTPMNSIIGFTGIVLQGLAGPLNPEQTKQLGMVQTSARHLMALINDVLDISKIEAGQVEVRCAPFDLRSSLQRIVASLLPLAEKRGLTLRLIVQDALRDVESDQRRVEQIALNLLNNAIKFTDQGGVTVTVNVTDTSSPLVRVRVADTGIGMKEADIPMIFQPFRQIDSGLRRQREGTGLGLAICRRLTELLGGTITAESTWGQGSTFTLSLPVKRDVTP